MFFFLSHLSDPVDKIDRIDKIVEFESALDLVFLQFPFRDLFHSILELALFDQVSHTGTTSITRKSFCNAKSSAKRQVFGEDLLPRRRPLVSSPALASTDATNRAGPREQLPPPRRRSG